MELNKAIALIEHSRIVNQTGTWADLGCGEGLFTHALANVLSPQSVVYAIDEKSGQLNNLTNKNNISMIRQVRNFERDELDTPPLDGILMANSIHYISDKVGLIRKLEKSLKPESSFLIVEYDTMRSNQWVPFPIDFLSLTKLFNHSGFSSVEKLGEVASVYQKSNIYAALIWR